MSASEITPVDGDLAGEIERRAEALAEAHQKLMRDLVHMRRFHHLTQAEVAARMGVSQPVVSDFERYDSNPTLATLRRYALAVGAKLGEYVHDDCGDPAHVDPEFDRIIQGAAGTWFVGRRQPSQNWQPAVRASVGAP